MSRAAAVALILAVGLLARLGFAWAGGAGTLARTESAVVADHLNAGEGFVFEQYGARYVAWKEPLHMHLLALLTRQGWHDRTVRAFQTACGLLAALLVAWMAQRIWGSGRAALVAGLLAAANPFLVYYDVRWVHPLSFDAALAMAAAACGVAALRAGPHAWRWVIGMGLVAGLGLWQRATLLPAVAGFWSAAVLAARPARAWSARGLAVVAIALLCLSPWLARNYARLQRVVVTTDTAHIFWLGNHPGANGTYSDAQGRRWFHTADAAFQRRVLGASELGQYDLFMAEAGRFVREQPGAFARLIGQRLLGFFWFSPNAGVMYTPAQRRLYGVWYAALLGWGVWAAARQARPAGTVARAQLLALLGFVLGLAAVHALTAVNLKHRVPWELVLAIYAAAPRRSEAA